MKTKHLFLSMLALLASATLRAYNFEQDGLSYKTLSPTEVSVVGQTVGHSTLIIPSDIIYNEKPYSVISIGDGAFRDHSRLTSVTILGATSIGDNAFQYCSGLTSVTIPSVTSIGIHAFSYCENLISVTIPESVTSIGGCAFSYCRSLTSIQVEEGNTTYDSRDNCNAIIETATNTLITGCQTTIIPNSVTSIGEWAFLGNSKLTSITIPSSVTSIGEGAFFNCQFLTSVHISDLEAWCKIAFSDNDSNPLYQARSLFLNGEEISYLVIPNSVTSIGDFAFYNWDGLTSITIPNSVTNIGKMAFDGCDNLTSVNIPESVTSIGFAAFQNCWLLTSVTIPNSVTSIGDRAFAHDQPFETHLHDVYCYAEKLPNTGSNAFQNSSFSSPTLHVPAASLEDYSTTAPWSSFGTISPIYDEESSKPFPAGTYVKADLKRTFAEGWNTICLPFAINDIEAAFGTGAKAYGFDDFVGGELKFSKVTTLAAGTPYVIYVPAEITELIAFENIVVEESNTTSSSILKNGVCFRGTYAPVAPGGWTKENSTDNIYGLTADGRIRKAGADADILGFRGYFDIPAGTAVKGFVFEDGATGIETIDHSSLTINKPIYNVAGQRIKKIQKGINIINGKKILK